MRFFENFAFQKSNRPRTVADGLSWNSTNVIHFTFLSTKEKNELVPFNKIK
jgi:hypothetical protein